jgi:hypothetical protein
LWCLTGFFPLLGVVLATLNHEAAFRAFATVTLPLHLATEQFASEHLCHRELGMLRDNPTKRAAEAPHAKLAVALLRVREPAELFQHL